jgi:DNA polymerase-3 subunit gamma/tau
MRQRKDRARGRAIPNDGEALSLAPEPAGALAGPLGGGGAGSRYAVAAADLGRRPPRGVGPGDDQASGLRHSFVFHLAYRRGLAGGESGAGAAGAAGAPPRAADAVRRRGAGDAAGLRRLAQRAPRRGAGVAATGFGAAGVGGVPAGGRGSGSGRGPAGGAGEGWRSWGGLFRRCDGPPAAAVAGGASERGRGADGVCLSGREYARAPGDGGGAGGHFCSSIE